MVRPMTRESGCPPEAAWLRYLDGEGDAEERGALRAHLEHCGRCRDEVAALTALVMRIDRALLDEPCGRRTGGPPGRHRLYGGAVAAAAVLGIVLTAFGPARRALADAMTVFEPRQIEAVPVSPNALRRLADQLTRHGTVSLDAFGSVHVLQGSAPYTTSSTTLAARTGLPDLWPAALGPATAVVHPAQTAVFMLNVAHINAWLATTGATTLFPRSLTGDAFRIHVPTVATLKAAVRGGSDVLVEMGAPALDVPRGVPLDQVRDAVLNLPFLPENLRFALSAVGNWRKTLVLPLPGHPENVTFLGHPAVIEPAPDGTSVSVIWIQPGAVAVFTESRAAGITPDQFRSDLAQLFAGETSQAAAAPSS